MAKELTVKEAKLVQGIAMGKTKQEAAIDAGYGTTPGSSSAIASDTLKKPKVQEALAAAFYRHGIDIDSATKPIADGLKAIKLQEIKGELKALPDHSVRLNASWKAFTLMGMTGQQEGGVTNINFVNVVNDQSTKYGI